MRHGTVEVILPSIREASAAHHLVIAQLGFDKMLAYRNGDSVAALCIALLNFAIGGQQLTIHIELYALGRNVRAGIVNVSLHGERRHILEVDVVSRQRGGADEHRACDGIELMLAVQRGNLVVGAALLERNTAYDIVAILVGHTVETQLLRHGGRRRGIKSNLRMVQLVDAVLTGHVEGIVLHTESLVERPVEHQTVLRTTEDTGVVGFHLFFAQGSVP